MNKIIKASLYCLIAVGYGVITVYATTNDCSGVSNETTKTIDNDSYCFEYFIGVGSEAMIFCTSGDDGVCEDAGNLQNVTERKYGAGEGCSGAYTTTNVGTKTKKECN